MKLFSNLLILTGMTAVVLCQPAAAQQTEYPVFEKDNRITRLTKKIEFVTLKPKDGRLVPEFQANNSRARSEFQTQLRKAGSLGSLSSLSSGTTWSTTGTSEAMQIAAGYGMARIQPYRFVPQIPNMENSFWMKVLEVSGELILRAGDDESLFLRFENGSGNELFQFSQDAKGKISCLEFGSGVVFAGSANTFDLFTQMYPDYVEKRLAPIFKLAGLGAPPNIFGGHVRNYVMEKLRPKDAERQAKFKEMVQAMSSESYQERQQATKAIEGKASDWLYEIEHAISDTGFEPETRARLKRIYDKRISKEDRGNVEAAEKDKLYENSRYLVWLLRKMNQEKIDSAERQLVVKALQEITEQKLGDEPGKWQAWLAKNGEAIPGASASESATEIDLFPEGKLGEIKDGIKTLISLKIEDGQLKFDREIWTKTFGGKSVQELSKEVKEFLKERNLPEDWFSAGGNYPIELTKAPQLLFQRVVEELPVDKQVQAIMNSYRNYQINSLNRRFVGSDITANLDFHFQSNNNRFHRRGAGGPAAKAPDEKFVSVRFNELSGPQRKLEVREDVKGNLKLNLKFEKDNALIRLVRTVKPNEQGEQYFLYDIRGSDVVVRKATSYEKLRQDHSDYFKDQFDPMFERIGVMIPK